MRLLVVTQYFWPEQFRINELVSELVARGHDVTVLAGRPNYPDGVVFPEYHANPARFSEYHGARIVRVPMLARGKGRLRLVLNYASFAASASLLGPLRLRGLRFDAIFVFEPSPVTVGLPAIVLRRLKRAPLAFWVLDQWPETLEAVGILRSRAGLALIGRLVSFIYRRCDLILGQSRSLVSRIAGYCPAAVRVDYFPNWAESAYASEAAAAAPAPEVPVREGAFTVMFAGNIGESQDFPAILDAAERLAPHPHIRWVIVGDGRVAAWVKAEVQRRTLQDVFLLMGRHPTDRMLSFYRHADALLVSLKRNPIFAMTTPGKVQSYLAAGVPILGMLDGEGARVITESGAGFACPAGDSAALAEAVLRLSRLSAAERRAMGIRAREYCHREFDRDMLLGRLETWLLELTALRARGSA